MLLFDRPRPCNQGICSVAIEIDDLRGISRKQQIVIDPSWHALLLDHEPELGFQILELLRMEKRHKGRLGESLSSV